MIYKRLILTTILLISFLTEIWAIHYNPMILLPIKVSLISDWLDILLKSLKRQNKNDRIYKIEKCLV